VKEKNNFQIICRRPAAKKSKTLRSKKRVFEIRIVKKQVACNGSALAMWRHSLLVQAGTDDE